MSQTVQIIATAIVAVGVMSGFGKFIIQSIIRSELETFFDRLDDRYLRKDVFEAHLKKGT